MAFNNTTLGTFYELGGSGIIESLARTGLDYIIIDCEHSYFNDESVAEYIIAAENGDLLPYVRVGDIRRPNILRMVDMGARALIIPHIHTPEEVKEIVSYAKFAPVGNRGFSPTRISRWGSEEWFKDTRSYMDECNKRCKIIPQCETLEALDNIEEIAAIEGVDGIFVGPCDLSIEMGIPLEFDNPKLIKEIERILKACKDNGKESVIFAGDVATAAMWAKKGFDSVACTLDATVLINAYTNLTNDFKRMLAE